MQRLSSAWGGLSSLDCFYIPFLFILPLCWNDGSTAKHKPVPSVQSFQLFGPQPLGPKILFKTFPFPPCRPEVSPVTVVPGFPPRASPQAPPGGGGGSFPSPILLFKNKPRRLEGGTFTPLSGGPPPYDFVKKIHIHPQGENPLTLPILQPCCPFIFVNPRNSPPERPLLFSYVPVYANFPWENKNRGPHQPGACPGEQPRH